MGFKLGTETLRAVVLAETVFTPVFQWKDGKRTDVQLVDEKNRPIFRATNIPAVFQGQATDVTLQSFHEVTLPAGSVVRTDPKGESFGELRGVSDTGTRFVEERLTITAENFVQSANITDALK